ncbi:MAG: hypothetical protein R6X10_00600 [Desulfobacterales bacterium]
MNIKKEDIPIKINTPGAVARQKTDFGDASGYGKIGGEYFSMGEGTDIEPLLQGLEGNLCNAPHWGYLIDGEITVTYTDGTREVVQTGDLFYWPPGHTVKAGKNSEFVLFSPQAEHTRVIDHMNRKING